MPASVSLRAVETNGGQRFAVYADIRIEGGRLAGSRLLGDCDNQLFQKPDTAATSAASGNPQPGAATAPKAARKRK